MARFKSDSGDGDPFYKNVRELVSTSLKRSVDRLRTMRDWMRPVKCSDERNYGHRLKNWMSAFKCSTTGDRGCKLKEWYPMLMTTREVWFQRWRCSRVGTGTEVSEKRSNLQKWQRVVRGIVISTCFITAVQNASLRTGVVLVPITVVVVSSIFPTRVSAESALEPEYGLDFDAFPVEIQGRILGNLRYEQVFQLKSISKTVKSLAESDEFQASPSRKKPSLTACYFFIDHELVWKWAGFDPSSKEWRLLPPLSLIDLPADCKPDPDLFKEFLICAKDGLVCINFSKSPDRERLIVFNPLSGVWKELPSLNHRRNPVVMHILVNPETKAYQVIVAGSSKSGDEHLSKITEVFDSCTGIWKRTGDILGPVYALNEFQSGVYQDGKLFCIGFVEENDQVAKGIIAYDVEEGKWSSRWMHLLPFSLSSTILQLVENNGEIFLFSERENGRSTEHWVDRLEWTQADGDESQTKNTCQLINVIRKKKNDGRSLEVYPEFTCAPYDEGHLCIVNAINHTGKVYDIRDPEQSEFPLPLPGEGFRGELGFFSLNPMSFTIEPSFSSKVYQPFGESRLKSENCVEDQGVEEGPERGPQEIEEVDEGSEKEKEKPQHRIFEEKLVLSEKEAGMRKRTIAAPGGQ